MKVELLVISGAAKGKRFVFDKPDCFLFGRAADAHISLPHDMYVSRQHFFLEIAPPVCKLRDLNSKNGVIVNGVRYGGKTPLPKEMKQAPINETLIKDGDEISVGDTRIKVFIEIGAPDRPAPSAPNMLRCVRCGKEFASDVRNLPQTNYVCLDCRKRQEIGTTPQSGQPENSAAANAPKPSKTKTPTKALTIQGYQMMERLGAGRMGEMFKAREDSTGQIVAVKVFHSRVMLSPSKLKILQREFVIIRQLRHEHIVQFLGHGIVGNLLYFVFEFVDGITLKDFISAQAGRAPLEELAAIFLGVLDGLAYAHRARLSTRTSNGVIREWEGIIHRDLSPESILLARGANGWLPKLTDFQLSKTFEDAGITDITTPEDMLGRPMYWPREQLTHYKYLNPATDVFSAAAIFYEALTGKWIREGFQQLLQKGRQGGYTPSMSDYMTVIATRPVVPIRERIAQIPEPLARVIDRALREKEIPQDDRGIQKELRILRYPDAGVFRENLLKAFQEIGVGASNRAAQASPDDGASSQIMLSHPPEGATCEAALLLLDVVQSTQYVVNVGDTQFGALVSGILRRARAHPLSSSLIFLKGTGDGFLAAFHSMDAALAVAESYLKEPVDPQAQVRIALHWGSAKVGVGGDFHGLEIHRVTAMEGVGKEQLVEAALPALPMTNRLLISAAGIEQLSAAGRARFQLAGLFKLKGFEEPNRLWILRS